eukprot:jgi/Hompol1/5713/HPOL_002420-RA
MSLILANVKFATTELCDYSYNKCQSVCICIQKANTITACNPNRVKDRYPFRWDPGIVPPRHAGSHVSVAEGAVTIAQDGSVICAADSQHYKLVHLDTGACIPLFPYERSQMSPIIVVIGDGEFLIVTASAQGVGLGTLQWPSVPTSMVFLFPYIIALLKNNMLQIHNFKTQDLVQTIVFPEDSPAIGISLAQYPLDIKIAASAPPALASAGSPGADHASPSEDGDVQSAPSESARSDSRETLPGGTVQAIITFESEILGLRMIPWETQIERLLDSQRPLQAVTLGEQMLKLEEDSAAKRGKLARLNVRSGLLFIQEAKFQQALSCLRRGRIDPRALDMLLLYLSDSRKSKNLYRPEFRQAVDSTLLKLYAESDSPLLYDLLASTHSCTLEDCQEFLTARSLYHAQSLLYKSLGMHQQAIDLWIQIASGELVDVNFTGIQAIVDLLTEMQDEDLVLRYAEWVISRDPQRGVMIFTNRNDGLFDVARILEFLEPFGSRALMSYLEYLTSLNADKDPALQTRLAFLYIEAIADLATDDAMFELGQRIAFQCF